MKSCACGLLLSAIAMPRSCASVKALTSFTASSVCPESRPLTTWIVSSRLSRSAMRPMNSTSTASTEVPDARAAASWPRLAHNPTNGPTASRSSAAIEGTLTALVTAPPVSAATACSAAWYPARSVASAVDAPRCGVTTTFGYPNSGWSVTGSVRKTSSAAPATLPESSAACRSASTISGPRATLRIRTPSFIFAKASAFSQPSVSVFFGRCTVMKSAAA